MKNRFKAILAAALCLALALSAAGCGKNGGSGGKSGKNTVSVYYFDQLTDRDNQFIEFCKTNYGVTVEPIITNWDGWEAKLLTDYSAGNAPDVIQIFEKVYPRIAIQNVLSSLDELESEGVTGLDNEILTKDAAASRDIYTYKGKTYSVATAAQDPVFIFVNETLYSEKGVKSPSAYYKEGNWNWDTMLTCAKAVTEDSNNDGETDIWGYGAWDMSYITRSNGAQFITINEDGLLKVNLNSQQMKTGLEMVDKMYHVEKVTPMDSNSWLAYFKQEKSGMLGSTVNNVISVLQDVGFEWSVIPYPSGPDNADGTPPGSIWGYSVVSSSKNKQAAVDYITACKDFAEKNPDSKQNIFNDEQKTLIKNSSQKVIMPYYHGVGDLWNLQWDFWWAVKGGTDISQVIAEYTPIFEGQAQVTMNAEPLTGK